MFDLANKLVEGLDKRGITGVFKVRNLVEDSVNRFIKVEDRIAVWRVFVKARIV